MNEAMLKIVSDSDVISILPTKCNIHTERDAKIHQIGDSSTISTIPYRCDVESEWIIDGKEIEGVMSLFSKDHCELRIGISEWSFELRDCFLNRLEIFKMYGELPKMRADWSGSDTKVCPPLDIQNPMGGSFPHAKMSLDLTSSGEGGKSYGGIPFSNISLKIGRDGGSMLSIGTMFYPDHGQFFDAEITIGDQVLMLSDMSCSTISNNFSHTFMMGMDTKTEMVLVGKAPVLVNNILSPPCIDPPDEDPVEFEWWDD